MVATRSQFLAQAQLKSAIAVHHVRHTESQDDHPVAKNLPTTLRICSPVCGTRVANKVLYTARVLSEHLYQHCPIVPPCVPSLAKDVLRCRTSCLRGRRQ